MKKVLFMICLLAVSCAGNEAAQSTFAGAPDLPALADLPSLPEGVHRNESAAFQYDWYWSEFFQKSDNAVPVDGALLLGSERSEVSWVMYEFGVNFDAGQAQFSVQCNSDHDGVVYVGFSNFAENRWQFEAVPFVVPITGPLTVQIADCQAMPSEDHSFFVVVLTWDGIEVEVERVNLRMEVANVAPQNLQASDGTHLEYIWITWDSVPYADGYVPEYKRTTDGAETWKPFLGAPAQSTSYSHDNLAGPGNAPEYNVLYDYRVRAHFIDDDWSDYSNVDSGYRRTPPPRNVEATSNIIVEKVHLTWDQVWEVPDRSYKVYRKRSTEDVYVFMDQTISNWWLDEDLPDTATYDYVIETIGPDGPSEYSEVAQGSALTFDISTCVSMKVLPSDIRLLSDGARLLGAYFSSEDNDLIATQLVTMPPAGADDWRQFPLGQSHGEGRMDLSLLDGKPALAFTVPDELRFAWCSEGLPLDAPVWTTTILNSNTDNTIHNRPAWLEAGGVPFVGARIDNWVGMFVFFATVAEPTRDEDWLQYGLRTFSAGEVMAMQLIDSRPVLLYNEWEPDTDLGFMKSDSELPPDNTHWTRTDAVLGDGFIPEAIEMVIHQGTPLFAYCRYPSFDPDSKRVLVFRGSTESPSQNSDWLPSGLFSEPGASYGVSLDLAIVNERPGICFYDETNATLMLAMSKDVLPDVDSWFLSNVTGTNGVGKTCAVAEYGGLPVLLFFDEVKEEISFALGQ